MITTKLVDLKSVPLVTNFVVMSPWTKQLLVLNFETQFILLLKSCHDPSPYEGRIKIFLGLALMMKGDKLITVIYFDPHHYERIKMCQIFYRLIF